ncbi:MAG: asparagine synthetase [Thermoplasmata archaeon]|nr:MAG: asparagine synthetase [Thermoplasmata archaeon]
MFGKYCNDVVEKCYKRLTWKNLVPIISIKDKIREEMANFLRREGFIEISPVIISPITDPLAHPIFEGGISYYGDKYYLTRSMIFHKQMALLAFKKIFCFSPNIRLELKEKAKSRRHLTEFTQLDLEVREASREEIMELGEKMLIHILTKVKKCCKKELELLGRDLCIPSRPFKRIPFEEAYAKYGEEYESIISKDENGPFWIVDFPIWKREFYDKEYEDKEGYLIDMDLIYPEGYGEALSGGEREYKHERIIERMKKSGMDMEKFSFYLEIVKKGLYPSAGFGIGLERLVKFICGLNDIQYAILFPKIPGEYCI